MVFVASSNDGDTRAAVGAVFQQLRDRAAAQAPTNGAPRFSTYGEQFGPMLVNRTLTGVVFGGGEVARG